MVFEAVATPAPGQNRAPRPAILDDQSRVRAVRRLLEAGAHSEALDQLVELTAQLLNARYAQVSLLSTEQVVAAVAGKTLALAERTSPAEESLCAVTLRHGSPLVLPDAASVAEVASLPPVRTGTVGAYLGVPLVSSGVPVGAVCVYDPAPREWTERDVEVLRRLAISVSTELELRAVSAELATSATRLDLALEAASIGSFDLDVGTGHLSWDRRLIELFGYDPAAFQPHMDSFVARLHPQDRDRVMAAVDQAIACRGELDVEYRIVLPDGRTRWFSARGRTIEDGAGRVRLLGASFDSTNVREGRDQVARVLETMTDAFFSVDRNWRFTYVNAQAEQLLGRTAVELLGRNVWEEFPDARGESDFFRKYHQAMRTGHTVTFEDYYPPPLDKWFDVRAWPTPDGLSVYFHDITTRRQAERERAQAYAETERAQARLALLADITRVLVSTLDVDDAMNRLVRLVVPRLADWASVTLVDDAGQLRHSVARHRDAERAADIERFATLHTQVATEGSYSRRVARTGEPALLQHTTPRAVAGGWRGEELTHLLDRLGFASAMIVPLRGRDRTLGVLVFVADPSREPFSDDDFATAVEVGQRAGLAVDNGQLYGLARTAAEVLQRSLLTPLPEPDHLELVARYRPAGEQAQVGGDFFWAALQPDGATLIAIGDVMGHDIGAAAAMGQVQNLLRGIAYDSQDSPAGVLTRVDRAMRGLQVDTMATSIVARIEQTSADRPSGRRHLRWSNAGHPPPMIARADGRIQVLDEDTDLLLGLEPSTERIDHTTVLQGGDTLLLYTDGLVERRDSPLDRGLARLRQALTGGFQQPLEQLCEGLLARLLPENPEDDVAIIALRSHPEDQPRPAEAGPRRVPPLPE